MYEMTHGHVLITELELIFTSGWLIFLGGRFHIVNKSFPRGSVWCKLLLSIRSLQVWGLFLLERSWKKVMRGRRRLEMSRSLLHGQVRFETVSAVVSSFFNPAFVKVYQLWFGCSTFLKRMPDIQSELGPSCHTAWLDAILRGWGSRSPFFWVVIYLVIVLRNSPVFLVVILSVNFSSWKAGDKRSQGCWQSAMLKLFLSAESLMHGYKQLISFGFTKPYFLWDNLCQLVWRQKISSIHWYLQCELLNTSCCRWLFSWRGPWWKVYSPECDRPWE